MLTTNEVARVYDTILSTPGMNDTVKINLKLSRREILLLSSVITHGIKKGIREERPYLLRNISAEGIQELTNLSVACLEKAGLVELNERLNSLSLNSDLEPKGGK